MSIKEGIYLVTFATPLGHGEGLVVLANGKMRGGDAGMYYSGTYTEDGSTFKSSFRVGRHSNPPGNSSVFGVDNFTVNVIGTAVGDAVSLKGTSPEAVGISFTASLRHIAD